MPSSSPRVVERELRLAILLMSIAARCDVNVKRLLVTGSSGLIGSEVIAAYVWLEKYFGRGDYKRES